MTKKYLQLVMEMALREIVAQNQGLLHKTKEDKKETVKTSKEIVDMSTGSVDKKIEIIRSRNEPSSHVIDTTARYSNGKKKY